MTTPPPPRPVGAPDADAAVAERVTLRTGLRRLSTGLLWYGAIGITLAVLGLVALLYVGNRLGTLADTTSRRIETLVTTVDRTADVINDAGSTALSFANTLERTPPTVRQAATTVTRIHDTLLDIQAQLGSVQILGSRPLAGISDRFGQLATDIDGLDARLELIATDLEGNRDSLVTISGSLTALGQQLEAVADDLRSGFIEDGLEDVRLALLVLIVVFVIWTAVPAVGALILGLWLRRTLGA